MKHIKQYFSDTVKPCEKSPTNMKNSISSEHEYGGKSTKKVKPVKRKISKRDSKNKINIKKDDEDSVDEIFIDDSSYGPDGVSNEHVESNAFKVLMNRNKPVQNDKSPACSQESNVSRDLDIKETSKRNNRKSNASETKEKMENKAENRGKVSKKNGKIDNQNDIPVNGKERSSGLFNYFSKLDFKMTDNDMVKMSTVVVKADVHISEMNVTKPIQKRIYCKTDSKIMDTKLRRRLSEMNNIEVISSEDLSMSEDTLENHEVLRRKTKSRWAFQIKSLDKDDDYMSGNTSDEALFSPKRKNKSSNQNKKVNGKRSAEHNKLKLHGKEKSKVQENIKSDVNGDIVEKNKLIHKDKLVEENKLHCNGKEEKWNKGKSDSCDISILEVNPNDTFNDSKIVSDANLKRKCPEVLAPLFTKKRKPDPLVAAARRLFLQPDMVNNGSNNADKSPNAYTIPLLPFPTISHVTQIDSNLYSDGQDIQNIPMKNFEKYTPTLNTTDYKHIVNLKCSSNEPTQSFCKLKNVEEGLSEIGAFCKDASKMWTPLSLIAKGQITNMKVSPKRRGRSKKSSNKESMSTETKDNNDEIHNNIWTYKYKPRSSEEIVGNEEAGEKLRDWLVAWKSSPAIREDISSGDEFYSSDCSRSSSNEKNQVAVLIGPHGCGKSASVYAIAEEFGYSVLEVNASAKRPGKKILKDLEEATKSHRIKKDKTKPSFLSAPMDDKKKPPQNSLILFEDVDLIFEEDEGFVSAVNQLASNTKTPIVMTCTSVFANLSKMAPQQNRIYFQNATGDRVPALLGLIALAESGYKLPRNYLLDLSQSGDLRKAIIQLQYLLISGTPHVLRHFADYKNRLWQDMRSCLYKPMIKSIKERTKEKVKDTNHEKTNNDAADLHNFADSFDSLCLLTSLIEIDDPALNLSDVESLPNLSLAEDMSPYSHLHVTSSEIAEWISDTLMQRKKEMSKEEQNYNNNILLRKQLNKGVDRALSHVTSFQLDYSVISVDYLPLTRSICRIEKYRASKSNNKRGNRFFHYLNNLKVPVTITKPNILDAACKVLQEKSAKE